ncbi:MAG TPA: glycosyltransferase family 2 protein [Acidimicrobiia bacterium]
MLRRLGLRPRLPGPWVVAQQQPVTPKPLDDFRLFAIIGAWMEEDVIAATVANAFAQGCERVYLVDNDSSDATVAEAVGAGAVLAEVFATEQYDEVLRLDIMNRVVSSVSEESGSDHVWWLWLDADEFPHGPRGTTVREYLEPLDRRFRIVGGRFINHFPDREPAYVPGFHPLDFQPLCEEHLLGCALRHRKHPLQRFDRGGTPIVSDRGFHRATSAERPLLEPTEAIYLHHFPYRDQQVTRRRLALLCSTDETGRTRVQEGDDAADGMVPRFETLDAVYRGDWDRVRNYRFDGEHSVARPVPWTSLAGPEDVAVRRWYATESAEGRS